MPNRWANSSPGSGIDQNSDGIIDRGEWQTGMENSNFVMDGISDSVISAKEVDALGGPIGVKTGDLAAGVVVLIVKKILFSMDKDADCSVSLTEFTTNTDAMFKKLDADGKGTLGQDEINNLPLKLIGN